MTDNNVNDSSQTAQPPDSARKRPGRQAAPARPRKKAKRTPANPGSEGPGSGDEEPGAEHADCQAFLGMLDDLRNTAYNAVVVPGKKRQVDLSRATDGLPVHPGLPTVKFGADWTEQDEAAIQSTWEATKDVDWRLMKDSKRYGKLFRTCMQFAGCTPWDVVGCRTKLRYKRGRYVSATGSAQMWGAKFCDNLNVLITHCAWPSTYPLALANHLAAAIQYVVILRTGDRRPWDPTFQKPEHFQLMMRNFSRQSDGRFTVQEVHRRVVKDSRKMGISLPNFSLSHVFTELEKLITSPAVSTADGDEYMVSAFDLATLIRALDNMAMPTGVICLPTFAQYYGAIACRSGEPQPSHEDLGRYHEAAIKEELRRQRRRDRSHMSSVAAGVAADVVGEVVHPPPEDAGNAAASGAAVHDDPQDDVMHDDPQDDAYDDPQDDFMHDDPQDDAHDDPQDDVMHVDPQEGVETAGQVVGDVIEPLATPAPAKQKPSRTAPNHAVDMVFPLPRQSNHSGGRLRYNGLRLNMRFNQQPIWP